MAGQIALWSRTLVPTLKETPGEAEIKSHRLMLRAGLIRKLASGTYSYLPLGLRALRKAEAIVREEMDRAGAQELLMPAIHPAELWRESGRLEALGEDMVRFRDRHGRDNVLGPTHEEVITDIARREIRSYRQLPMNLYQIQTKFRDEMRPRSGVIRSREFLMKDAYSFHATEASLDETYNAMKETYSRIFRRCGLDFHIVQADPGAMGGSGSQEFVLFSDAGEDRMARDPKSGVVVSVEMSERRLEGLKLSGRPEKRHRAMPTPGHSSVEGVAAFLKKKPSDLVKTMIYESAGKLFAVLVRGDHEVSDYKVKKAIGADARLASRDTIDRCGSAFGFSGPLGLKLPLHVDEDILRMKDFVAGANRKDTHLVDVNAGDLAAEPDARVGDYRQVIEGDRAVSGAPLELRTAIELGHIFKLNLRYSVPLKAHFLDADGKEKPLIMGCYGIGINRILAAAIEEHADGKGIIWPASIAPYQVVVILVDQKDAATKQVIDKLFNSSILQQSGIDILVDDRTDSAGVKFNDADLIGFPVRMVVGPRNLKEGKVEIKFRKTGEMNLVAAHTLDSELIRALDKIMPR